MTQKFSDGAAMWDQRFSGDDYLFGREPNDYLRSKAPLLPAAGSVLCVADGEGRNSVWLAKQDFKVQAFDISEVGVAKARLLASEAGVSVDYTVADCEQYDWAEQSHDGVVAVFIQFADPQMRERLFANMVRALKPGGVLILQGYTPRQLEYKTGGPGQLSHLYTADVIREAFKDLRIVELVEYEAELNEGARHAGRSALLGLVATKP
jgi:SAM-dependent methyltransferase